MVASQFPAGVLPRANQLGRKETGDGFMTENKYPSERGNARIESRNGDETERLIVTVWDDGSTSMIMQTEVDGRIRHGIGGQPEPENVKLFAAQLLALLHPEAETSTGFKANNGFRSIHTPDLEEAIRYAKSGVPGGYVEKIDTVTTVVFRDDF